MPKGAIDVKDIQKEVTGLANFWLDVSRGKIKGHSTVLVRGHIPSQTAASGFPT